MYGIYAMAASGRMQYDYKQTNNSRSDNYSHDMIFGRPEMAWFLKSYLWLEVLGLISPPPSPPLLTLDVLGCLFCSQIFDDGIVMHHGPRSI